jgi:MoCo/4Fe-4S cofactor protein with predicted Tat translocation signal
MKKEDENNFSQAKEETKNYWRSLGHLNETADFLEHKHREFPKDATTLTLPSEGMDRRKFLNLMASSMALAGISTTGCLRRPEAHIVASQSMPENTIPGVPKQYATVGFIRGSVVPLSVTSMDGRPTKMEGNPKHPFTNPIAGKKLGSSNIWTQGEILSLYDPDRGQSATLKGAKLSKADALKNLKGVLASYKETKGEGLSLVFEERRSSSFLSLVQQFKKQYPKARVLSLNEGVITPERETFFYEAFEKHNVKPYYKLLNAHVILSLDADFLGTEHDNIKNAREFSEKRRLDEKNTSSDMSRLYMVEAQHSITGATADHRLALPTRDHAQLLILLAGELEKQGLSLPRFLDTYKLKAHFSPKIQAWAQALAKDLIKAKGRSLIMVGEREPKYVHAMAYLLNSALSNVNETVSYFSYENPFAAKAGLKEIEEILDPSQTSCLILLDSNLAYTLPAHLKVGEKIQALQTSFYCAYYPDETSSVVTGYFPKAHFLETWGDGTFTNGSLSLRQPLILPLFEDCFDEYEFLSVTLGETKPFETYEFVKEYWKTTFGSQADSFEMVWRRALSLGFFENHVARGVEKISPSVSHALQSLTRYAKDYLEAPYEANELELNYYYGYSTYDGRYSNNGWLQEIPDPISKLVWDNALLVSPKTASKIGVRGHHLPTAHAKVDMVNVATDGGQLKVAVWEVPGLADDVLILNLGYGKTFGTVAKNAGFDANKIRHKSSLWFSSQVKLQKTSDSYELVTTQEHGAFDVDEHKAHLRSIREGSLATYVKDPYFVLKDEVIPIKEQKDHLFNPPKDPAYELAARQQWGMSIDLNSCIGCQACTIACQAENNISVVGKEEVFRGREMHWMRVDRYFTGHLDNPETRGDIQTRFQPMTCQHCETAPCEAVCPVAATMHSPDGLNDMTYNRCVGTRYCANNCPYKVRKFNFFTPCRRTLTLRFVLEGLWKNVRTVFTRLMRLKSKLRKRPKTVLCRKVGSLRRVKTRALRRPLYLVMWQIRIPLFLS